MSTFDTVVAVLRRYPETRNRDFPLVVRLWQKMGKVRPSDTIESLMLRDDLPNPRTIERYRRKAQRLHPELGPTDPSVRRHRDEHRTDEDS